MHHRIQLVGVWQAPVNIDNDDLPEHIHKADAVVLHTALGYKDNCSPHAIIRKPPFPKLQLYYLHHNPPLGRVRVFLCLWYRKPDLQVLCPHPLRDPVAIWTNARQESFNFLLSQDSVCHVNQLYHYGYGVIKFIVIDIIIRLNDISMSLCIIKL